MKPENILSQLNIFGQCKQYGISFWQCPQFLFLIMGLINIASSLTAWSIGNKFIDSPEAVILIVLSVTVILFIIAFIIVQSFDKLAQANRMKSEFISIVSHQLRSPLTNLKWALDFLTSGNGGMISEEKKVEYYKTLSENAERMGELIDNLLIVSRMEQGKIVLKKEMISLEELIRGLIHDFQPFATASNVKIKFKAEDKMPKIFADPYQVKLLVDNLLNNAIRYTKNGGMVEIGLSSRKEKLFFEIKDSGVGIPKEDQKYIFQKFFRAGNALKQQTQGSGLGLYIAKSVVASSGGKINFKSEEGKGSTFWFTLPIK
ncbi:MAG: hypothetical protein A3A08_00165 [Candidatus Nealsonbacteria bacterium RIFCSPLOWO2_01_FULL_41_9]|uniref:histidine kinase n=1 Tax=Candidatus Nealsonbacteria bacterium RIFCSPLOWO2_01_FULL_41_9 TaxID=1801671 RepID=A0A1G2ECL6_9BACT|nr:MAG: hypothetical protein A3A08_00165 [Candidatus Nealsonbacteria bacterium RIFCSPLOWO2_01_FULL_41_9]